jgi:diadenosine tetraphosphate (Ap4A) HIT family hydrolase
MVRIYKGGSQMDNAHCLICKSIREIESKRNPYVLKACKTGYAVLGWHQYYEGYTLFLCKKHVFELHELVEPCRTTFLQEMATLAEAVYRAFKPVKLNYELLTNISTGTSSPAIHMIRTRRNQFGVLINKFGKENTPVHQQKSSVS